jgi:1-acyl-sn-glycerol-3-phosphate acyltransferase
MLGGLAYWAVGGLAVTFISFPLRWLLPANTGGQLGRTLLNLLFRGFVAYLRATDLVRADLTPLDHLATHPGPLIIAPNHAALWDAVFLVSRLPRAVCVMKQSVLKNPFLGGGAQLAGYIPNSSTSSMIRESVVTLHEGGHLLVFPEGTRTHAEARWVNRIKGGCALIACRSGAPIVPVFIRNDSRFLQKGWPLWRAPRFPIRLRIDVGDPVDPQKAGSPQVLTAQLQAIFETELAKPDPLRRQSTTSVQA